MAYREIMDGDGRLWRVWDVYPYSRGAAVVIDDLANGWLTFETDGEKRRLTPVPARWSHLDAPSLLPLLHRSERVARRTSSLAGVDAAFRPDPRAGADREDGGLTT